MQRFKSFVLVVLSMSAQLWTGFFNRNPEFYDKHTASQSKSGYIVFVSLSTVATIGLLGWLYTMIYG